jgi:hypothetical protein
MELRSRRNTEEYLLQPGPKRWVILKFTSPDFPRRKNLLNHFSLGRARRRPLAQTLRQESRRSQPTRRPMVHIGRSVPCSPPGGPPVRIPRLWAHRLSPALCLRRLGRIRGTLQAKRHPQQFFPKAFTLALPSIAFSGYSHVRGYPIP